MEEISGIKINDGEALNKVGLNPRQIAENCTHIILTMTLQHGFVHADPHAGNFFVLPDNVVALIDYGTMGRLDDTLRGVLLRIFMAIAQQDAEQMADEFLMLDAQRTTVKRQALKRDFEHLIQLVNESSLRDIGTSHAFRQFVSVARRQQLQLPGDLVLFFKVLAMSEGLGMQIDPEFRMIEFSRPYFKRFWLNKASPFSQLKRLVGVLPEISELGFYFAKHTRHMAWQFEHGEMNFNMRVRGLEEIVKDLEAINNRVSASIITAALIIGLGLLMLIYHPAGWENYIGWIFGSLFAAVVVLGLLLLRAPYRMRRHAGCGDIDPEQGAMSEA